MNIFVSHIFNWEKWNSLIGGSELTQTYYYLFFISCPQPWDFLPPQKGPMLLQFHLEQDTDLFVLQGEMEMTQGDRKHLVHLNGQENTPA